MKIFILIFSLVQHCNRRSIIDINELYQLVLGQFPTFWLRYAGIFLWPSTYLFIFSRLFLLCQFFVVNISQLLLSEIYFTYLLSYLLTYLLACLLAYLLTNQLTPIENRSITLQHTLNLALIFCWHFSIQLDNLEFLNHFSLK